MRIWQRHNISAFFYRHLCHFLGDLVVNGRFLMQKRLDHACIIS